MKYIKINMALGILFFFFASLALPVSIEAVEVTALTLEDAIKISLQNNLDIKKGKLELEKAEIMRDEMAQNIDSIPVEGAFSTQYQSLYSSYQQTELAVRTKKKALEIEEDRVKKEVINAYTTAIKNYNAVEKAKLQYSLIEKQNTIASLSKEIGIISEYDYASSKLGKKQLEEAIKLAQSQYEGSISELRRLLGQSPNWEIELVSRPVIESYPRHELSTEISRGISESVLVWSQEFLVALEEIKQKWTMPYIERQIQDIDFSVAKVDYENAKRQVRTMIEQLYYTIEAIEGQIQAAELNLQKAQQNLEIAELKYELGLITQYSLAPGSESLYSARLEAEKARLDLEDLKATLAELKANYAYLTGQTVYDPQDWIMQ